jgi:RecA-family ATPase
MTDVLAKPAPELGFLVPDYIPLGTVVLFSAHGGTGKSYLALQLMAAMATGTRWLGLEVMPGRSYGLFCEDPEAIIHRRQLAICGRLGIAAADLGDLHFTDRAGEECELFGPRERDPYSVDVTGLWHRFAAKVAQIKPRLIVVDTAADVFAGNENARPQVRKFVRRLAGLALRHDAAVLLCSHPSLAGMNTGSGLSGSTGWFNSVRAHLYMTTDEDDKDTRKLQAMKPNYAPLGPELRLRYDDGAFVRFEDETGELGRIKRKQLEREIVELVAEGEARESLYSAHARAEHRYLPAVFLRRHPQYPKSRVAEAMKDLLARGVLRETTRSNRLGRGLTVDPAHKPDKPA